MRHLLLVLAVAPLLSGCAAIGSCFATPACTAMLGAGLGYVASVNNLGTVIIGGIVGKATPPAAAPAPAKSP